MALKIPVGANLDSFKKAMEETSSLAGNATRKIAQQFLSMNNEIAATAGAAPISHGEIEAYGRLRREPLRGFEVDMIRALDSVYITDAAARVAGKSREPERIVASRPVSPALFDAVFSAG